MFLVAYEYPEGEPLPVANEPDGVNNFTYISYDPAGLDWKRWRTMCRVSFFPDIKQMPLKEREKWMVLDDQYFTFENMTRGYSVLDLMKIA